MQMTADFMAGMCFTFQARLDEALAHFRTAISLFPKVGDQLILQVSHENISYALLYRGDHAEALAEASRGLELAERLGDIRGTCNSGAHVALAALRLGDISRAQRTARLLKSSQAVKTEFTSMASIRSAYRSTLPFIALPIG